MSNTVPTLGTAAAPSTHPTTASQMSVPPSWDMPSNSSGIFPCNDEDRLANKSGYFVWAHRMRKALGYCALLDIVNGKLKEPSDASERAVWLKMDAAASALIAGCIKAELVIKIAHLPTAHAAWELLAAEFSQVGSRSTIDLFRRLTRHMPSGGDISAHISDYQETIQYIADSDVEWVVPDSFSVPLLLTTLPSDPKDPDSWDHFIKGVRINEAPTLSSTISEMLEEKRRQTPLSNTTMTSETTRVGMKFCINCKKEGHSKDDCWAKGGGMEGKSPRRRPKTKKKGNKK